MMSYYRENTFWKPKVLLPNVERLAAILHAADVAGTNVDGPYHRLSAVGKHRYRDMAIAALDAGYNLP